MKNNKFSYEGNTINVLKIIVSDIFSNHPFSRIRIIHFLLLNLNLYAKYVVLSTDQTRTVLLLFHFIMAIDAHSQMTTVLSKIVAILSQRRQSYFSHLWSFWINYAYFFLYRPFREVILSLLNWRLCFLIKGRPVGYEGQLNSTVISYAKIRRKQLTRAARMRLNSIIHWFWRIGETIIKRYKKYKKYCVNSRNMLDFSVLNTC